MKLVLAAVVLLVASIVVYAKPERKAPAPKKQGAAPVPAIAGETIWGFMGQDGRNIEIGGNERWIATGRIREDGTLYVEWYHVPDAKTAPGVYRLNADGSIVGEWGWQGDVSIGSDGVLKGKTMPDTLRVKPAGPIF